MAELLTTRETAKRLHLHPETVLQWVREGKLPAMKLPSGAIRFDPDQLEAWLRGRATPLRGVSTTMQDVKRAEV